MNEIVCKLVETDVEREGHFAVRHAVFVEEQQMFVGTDVDEHDHDEDTIHIVAVDTSTGKVVGAVRCYHDGDDVWYGGRLAVLKEYRHHATSIGANLCRLAEASVIERGCRQFLAYIQLQNVRFFRRLGWRSVGEQVTIQGKPHLVMEASLAAAAQPEMAVEQVGRA